MFFGAGLGRLWKNTGKAVYHNRFSGSLLDFRCQNKNKFKPYCKWAYPRFAAAATFSAKQPKNIFSLSDKSDLYAFKPFSHLHQRIDWKVVGSNTADSYGSKDLIKRKWKLIRFNKPTYTKYYKL